MLMQEQTVARRRFDQQLAEIRAKIETLPEEKRACFRSLADEAQQIQRSMETDCAKIQDLLDDMRLNEASVKFDLWAAADNIQRRLASDNPR